jgi:hypothetical protein
VVPGVVMEALNDNIKWIAIDMLNNLLQNIKPLKSVSKKLQDSIKIKITVLLGCLSWHPF